MTALAKALAICAGTVGGAAACVATGVVPAPLLDSPAHHSAPPAKVAHHHRHLAEDLEVTPTTYETGSPTESNEAEVEPEPQPQETQASTQEDEDREPPEAKRDPEEAPIEEAIAETPASESGATEYTESVAPPVTETAASPSSSSSGGGSSSGSSSSGSAAGEFGP